MDFDLEELFKEIDSSSFSKSSSSPTPTGGGGVIVSPTSGDGRGNDYHLPAGAPGGKGGQFTKKDVLLNLRKIREAPTMRNFVAYRKKEKQMRSDSLTENIKQSEEAVAPLMKKVIENSILSKYIKFNDFIRVLNDGEVKNQFSSKHSDGAYSFQSRLRQSRNMFGHDMEDSELGYQLEKYGMLQSKNVKSFFEEVGGGAGQYGDDCHISIVFKRNNVFDRTTYCLGDSLGSHVLPQLLGMNFDSLACVSGYYSLNRGPEENVNIFNERINKPCELGGIYGSPKYIEIQLHGKVSTSDISTVIIGGRNRFLNKLDSDQKFILNKCKELGIKTLINTGSNQLEEINIDESGNIYYNAYESEDISDD